MKRIRNSRVGERSNLPEGSRKVKITKYRSQAANLETYAELGLKLDFFKALYQLMAKMN
jgi:hypothetical protein